MVAITTGTRAAALAMALGLGLLGGAARAQQLKDVQMPKEPLVLAQQGSFFVGGHPTHIALTEWEELGPDFAKAFGEPGEATVDQMYVQFQKPPGSEAHVPIVFLHGCCLTSKTWETTPDGRMGWYEYFTRKGFATYLAEQAGRGRSGFNPAGFNEVREGQKPPGEQRRMLLATYQFAWGIFRFGPKYGVAWPDGQFPIDKVDELYKQVIPDLILTEVASLGAQFGSPTTDNPTVADMATLARDLGGAILVGHSQTSPVPTQAVLKGMPGIKGVIQLETGCFGNLTPPQVAMLAKVPMLVVVGDHWDSPQPPPDCKSEMQQINAAGGDMTFISLPDVGLHGNSHMFMQDKNNLQVADVLLDWIDRHVEHRKP
ncbi:MAG: hypothetical protein ACLQE9_06960 [Roseiarcus sp.]